jgi:hypothetical protein
MSGAIRNSIVSAGDAPCAAPIRIAKAAHALAIDGKDVRPLPLLRRNAMFQRELRNAGRIVIASMSGKQEKLFAKAGRAWA